METKPNILIKWGTDERFSVLRATNIQDKGIQLDDTCIGLETNIFYSGKGYVEGLIVAHGSQKYCKSIYNDIAGSFMLVTWQSDHKLSVVSKLKLGSAQLLCTPLEELVGVTTGLVYKKGEMIEARIEQTSTSKAELNTALKNLTNSRRLELKRKAEEIRESLSEMSPSMNQVSVHMELGTDGQVLDVVTIDDNSQVPEGSVVMDYKQLYEDERTRSEVFMDKIKNLQREIATLKTAEGHSNQVLDIGGGVMVPSAHLCTLDALSDCHTIFARNLLRLLFKEEEMIDRTVTGKSCNANKTSLSKEALDPVRISAIIKYTVSKFAQGGPPAAHKGIKKDIVSSLGEFLNKLSKKKHDEDD